MYCNPVINVVYINLVTIIIAANMIVIFYNPWNGQVLQSMFIFRDATNNSDTSSTEVAVQLDTKFILTLGTHTYHGYKEFRNCPNTNCYLTNDIKYFKSNNEDQFDALLIGPIDFRDTNSKVLYIYKVFQIVIFRT
jgi:hypothetical protein